MRKFVLAALLSVAFTGAAHADAGYNCIAGEDGPAGSPLYFGDCTTPDKQLSHDSTAYLGLTIAFGPEGPRPLLSAGLRSVKAVGWNSLRGGDLSASFDLRAMQFDTLKAQYIGGRTEALGSIGGGWSFLRNEPIATGGFELGSFQMGLDWGITSHQLLPTASLNTLRQVKINPVCSESAMQYLSEYVGEGGYVVFTVDGTAPFSVSPGGAFCFEQGPEFEL